MADNTVGTAYIQIIPSADGISGNITRALGPEATAAGKLAGTNTAKSMSSTLKSVGANMMKAGAVATALSAPLIAGINSTLSAYEEQMAAETKLTEIYKTRMGATEDAAKATMDLASSLQAVGVVGDEVQLSGAQQLATFAKYPETVDTLLPAMNNLLVQQNGLNATSGDAVNIANLMGKAMMGQTGALRRVGITFDEAQEKVLKYGTEEERAAMLTEVITQNVGNMNEVMADTPLGKIQQMKNSMGDLKEEVGAALAPAVSKLAQLMSKYLVPALQRFTKFLGKHKAIGGFVVALTGLLAVGGPLLMIIGGIASGISALIPVVTAVSAPVLGVVAAIGAAIAVLIAAYKNSETFRNSMNKLAATIRGSVIAVFNALKPYLQMAWNLFKQIAQVIGNVLSPVVQFLAARLQVLVSIFTKIASVALPPVRSALSAIGSVISSVAGIVSSAAHKISSTLNFSGIASKVRSAFEAVKNAITSPIETAKRIVNGAIEKIKNLFPIKMGKIFSGVKLPHFKISGGKVPWGIGGYGEKPKVSIEWYKKAEMQPYMFTSGTLFGAGERGDEILYGRKALLQDIAQVAGNGEININVYGTSGMDVQDLAAAVERRLIEAQNRRRLAWQ